MNDFQWTTAFIIMITYIIVDSLYALYTLKIQERNASHAATLGAFMYALLAYGVINYVNCFYYIIFVAIGSWIGTFFTVKYSK